MTDDRLVLEVVSGCTEFPICVDTHLRTNHVPLSTVRYDPVVKPLTIEERNELSNSTVNIKNGM